MGVKMINLKNQVAVVTGGSRGIGKATSLIFALAGADIAIFYKKDRISAEKTARTIENVGRRVILLRVNVEKMSECRKAVKTVIGKFGHIDILVNNAGIWEFGKIGEIKPPQWRKTIDVNLTGTFNMCSVAVPHMKKRKYGRIINVSSTAGQRGEPFHSHYAASKGGIISFTKSIAPELIKNGIWVNCIAPGWVETEMTSGIVNNLKKRREIEKSIPRGKISTPEEIAGPILFLASNFANNVVGEVLNVNGGGVLCG